MSDQVQRLISALKILIEIRPTVTDVSLRNNYYDSLIRKKLRMISLSARKPEDRFSVTTFLEMADLRSKLRQLHFDTQPIDVLFQLGQAQFERQNLLRKEWEIRHLEDLATFRKLYPHYPTNRPGGILNRAFEKAVKYLHDVAERKEKVGCSAMLT